MEKYNKLDVVFDNLKESIESKLYSLARNSEDGCFSRDWNCITMMQHIDSRLHDLSICFEKEDVKNERSDS